MNNTSILRYPGGKSKAVKLILPCIPSCSTLISPFFGGGSVEFAWQQSTKGKLIVCDLFKPLVNFWKEVKKNRQAVADNVKKYYPISKELFYSLKHNLEADAVCAAAQFYVINRASYSGCTLSGGMSKNHPRFTQSCIKRLELFKMENIIIDHDSVFNWLLPILKNNSKDSTAIYMDPPYLTTQRLYGEKGNTHKDFPHYKLRDLLNTVTGLGFKWVLSYNDTSEIRDAYKGNKIQKLEWNYGMNKSKLSNEILITNE
jgi:DNA adenine methylase